jgi:hypothetical protein
MNKSHMDTPSPPGIPFAQSMFGTTLYEGDGMTSTLMKGKWLLASAFLLGLALFLYFVFFCPADCH